MQWLSYFAMRLFVGAFRLIPFGVLYRISDGFAWFMEHIIGYRRKVMQENLARAFPDKSPEEIRRIMKGAYRNLTDITLETFKGFTTPIPEIQKRCINRNPELVNQYLDRGQPVILVGSHFNNWEYTGLTMPPAFHGSVVTAYKPIRNPWIDRFTNNQRSRTGMIMVSMDDTFAAMRKYQKEKAVFILLSDQSPSSRKSAQWLSFLGIETAFLPGTDFLARRFGFPVLYYHIERIKRGYYAVTFREVCPDPANAAPVEITKTYAGIMEQAIREQPEHWLWSHKRWKIRPEPSVQPV